MRTMLLVLPTLLGLLPAQKMPLPDGSGRQLQLFDLDQLLPPPDDETPDQRAAPAGPDAAAHAAEAQAFAALLGRFVEPPLGPGDDCRVLGGRWLAVLGTAQQLASLERLVSTAAAQRDRFVEVEVRLLRVGAAAFAAELQPRLTEVQRDGETSWETVVGTAGAAELAAAAIAAASEQLDAPRLLVAPLQRATMAVKTQTAYIKDFTLTRTAGALIADPVVDVAWDGWEAEVFAAPRADGNLGIACNVTFQQLEQPIAKFETTVPGAKLPLTIQLPRIEGTRLQQTAVLAPGALVVVAARKLDGDWLVALVRADRRAK